MGSFCEGFLARLAGAMAQQKPQRADSERRISLNMPSVFHAVVSSSNFQRSNTERELVGTPVARRVAWTAHIAFVSLLFGTLVGLRGFFFDREHRNEVLGDDGAKGSIVVAVALVGVVLAHSMVFNLAVARIRRHTVSWILALVCALCATVSVFHATYPSVSPPVTDETYGRCTSDVSMAPQLCRDRLAGSFFFQMPWAGTCPANQRSLFTMQVGSVTVQKLELW